MLADPVRFCSILDGCWTIGDGDGLSTFEDGREHSAGLVGVERPGAEA